MDKFCGILWASGNSTKYNKRYTNYTGFNSHGYPLVNTHTIDRYHVTWDLGWGDKNIKFYLIHVK